MAPYGHATSDVLFSWDEGLNWETYPISDTPIEVENIVIEPKANSLEFILYGTSKDETSNKGILKKLDFTGYFEPQCLGADKPDSVESDYEYWSPYDGRHASRCFMGRQITYVRRKRSTECFNGELIDREVVREPCECEKQDYECDVGYERTEAGGCEATEDFDPNATPEECPAGQYFEISRGYRKIPDNSCEGGISY